MTIRPIRSERCRLQGGTGQNRSRLGCVEGTPEGDELDILAILVEEFENRHYPVEDLEPVPFLLAHMEATGRTQTDLAKLFGSVPRASEVLGLRRGLSKDMIYALQEHWGIPASIMIKPYPTVTKGGTGREATLT